MIYFDAAATTLQKPKAVKDAVRRAMDTMSSPGRGNYESAARAVELLLQCREETGALFGVDDPEQVVFTTNATHALNIAIRSLVTSGSRVVISGYEHNAVTRCLHAIQNVEIHVVNTPLFDHEAMLRGFDALITPDTAAVICTHVSNVFGYILPIEKISALCRERGVPLIVDAAQSAGCIDIDQKDLQAAFIAMPGHKGLYGPQGTGILLCGDKASPILFGGTGSNSREQEMPEFLPDRLEAGTHNVPGIAGLLEGVRFVRELGINNIRRHSWQLKERMAEQLKKAGEYHVFSSENPLLQAGVLSFLHKKMEPESFCEAMSQRGYGLRGGYHCAPFAHQTAGTIAQGTVRFSLSVFNHEQEVTALGKELKKL